MNAQECPFCHSKRKPIAANEYSFAVRDSFPVSRGHALVIPTRHVASIMELNNDEYRDCWDLVREVQRKLSEICSTAAFNIGINLGAAAGQTVEHAHIHVIPRYEGDVQDPRGGVRHVIPENGYYSP